MLLDTIKKAAEAKKNLASQKEQNAVNFRVFRDEVCKAFKELGIVPQEYKIDEGIVKISENNVNAPFPPSAFGSELQKKLSEEVEQTLLKFISDCEKAMTK